MRIIAVDPGLSSGVAIFYDMGPWRVFTLNSMPTLELVSNELATGPCIIVYERWVQTRGHHTPQFDALEVIGCLKWLAHRYRTPIEPQDRAARKRVSHEVVRRFVQPKTDHEMDAAQHAILAAFRHGFIRPYELVDTIES